MPGTTRLPLLEAAQRWLVSSPDDTQPALRRALTDFVEGRYRGAARDLRRIHELRLGMLDDHRPLASLAEAGHGPWDGQTLGEAASHSATPDQGRLLFHLVRSHAPHHVLELGTNIGISAAYLATGLRYAGTGNLTTIEASGLRLTVASRLLDDLALEGVEMIEAYFDDVLDTVVAERERLDMAFVDGNHRLDATLRYFDTVVSAMEPGSVVVLDDIRWSEEMWEAWTQVSRSSGAGLAVDLGRTGLVVVG